MTSPASRHISPSYYFAQYLENAFPDVKQSPLIQQLKNASTAAEIKALEQGVSVMINSILNRTGKHRVTSPQCYALQTGCRSMGFRMPDSLEQAINEIELRAQLMGKI